MPTIVPTEEEIPAEAEASLAVEGGFAYGTLAELIAFAPVSSELHLRLTEEMEVREAPLKHLSQLVLMADEKVFTDAEYRVAIYSESPKLAAETGVELTEVDPLPFAEALDEDVMDIWFLLVKVEPVATPSPTPTVEPEPTENPIEAQTELVVAVDDYRESQWSPVHPTFALSGIPEGQNWSYAVVIYDERIFILSGDTYCPAEEGIYTVRFAILNEQGVVVDASENYMLQLDHTQPEVMGMIDESRDYTLIVDASDAMSGVQAISLDGGANWTDWDGSQTFVFTAAGKMTLPAGMVQVRDVAGNVWISYEDYVLAKIPKYYYSGGGGGGGGNSTPPKQHAAATEETEVEERYDALELQLPEEPVSVLTVDGEELPLSLVLANAEGFEIPEDYLATFTAELAVWPKAPEEDEEATDEEPKHDTLILTAVEEENLGDRFEYRWKLNGEVCRLLKNSDIDYLVLKVGDELAVFPTEGFTGGTQFTELKMLGMSNKKFDYTIAMTFNLDPDHIPMLSEYDFSETCDLAVQVEVEEMKYVLTAEQKGEMYYYGVLLGPSEMMLVPYGTYPTEVAGENID